MSSCQNGIVQPPCSNPPSRSSSSPPGACMTPSRDMNSETMSFLITPLSLGRTRPSPLRRSKRAGIDSCKACKKKPFRGLPAARSRHAAIRRPPARPGPGQSFSPRSSQWPPSSPHRASITSSSSMSRSSTARAHRRGRIRRSSLPVIASRPVEDSWERAHSRTPRWALADLVIPGPSTSAHADIEIGRFRTARATEWQRSNSPSSRVVGAGDREPLRSGVHDSSRLPSGPTAQRSRSGRHTISATTIPARPLSPTGSSSTRLRLTKPGGGSRGHRRLRSHSSR